MYNIKVGVIRQARFLSGEYTGGYVHPLHFQGFALKSMKVGDAYEK